MRTLARSCQLPLGSVAPRGKRTCGFPVTLAEGAWLEGSQPETACRWCRDGKVPVSFQQTPSGSLLVRTPRYGQPSCGEVRWVVDARVSFHDQCSALDGQVSRTVQVASRLGLPVDEAVIGVGSGRNGQRRRRSRLFSDAWVDCLVVDYKDRLVRFGREHLEAALARPVRRIFIVGERQNDALTWRCARRYKRRGARNRAHRALQCAANDVGPAVGPAALASGQAGESGG